ncbi:hypothetical protein, partial [Phyllobacterium endophyticum]|uniref:hypothetical protein n=1 Tax=Phyllobacterium endophyticum TaxID=1149773 RepID=UPI001AEF09E7
SFARAHHNLKGEGRPALPVMQSSGLLEGPNGQSLSPQQINTKPSIKPNPATKRGFCRLTPCRPSLPQGSATKRRSAPAQGQLQGLARDTRIGRTSLSSRQI